MWVNLLHDGLLLMGYHRSKDHNAAEHKTVNCVGCRKLGLSSVPSPRRRPASWDGGPLFVEKAHHRGKRGGIKTAPPEIGKIVVPAEPWQMGSQLEAIERRAVQEAPPPTLYGLPAGQASV